MTPYDSIEADLARGFYLFPVCITPSQSRPGSYDKTPLIKWRDGSSNDINQIRRWQARYPGCAWGIDHAKSGTCALDDDSGKKPEAVASLLGLEFEFGELPRTFKYRTITGGFQHIFRGSIRNSVEKKLGPGLDTRGNGGYSVAPCSRGYEVVDDAPIAEVPDWIVQLAGRPTPREERIVDPIGGWDTEHGIELATRFLQKAPPAEMGHGGNDRIYSVACKARDYGVSEETAKILMLEHWYDRCEPNNREESMLRVAGNAYTYGNKQPGNALPEATFEAFDEPKAPARFKLLTSEDVDEFPPLSWRIKGLLPSRGIFQLYGPYGSGKSFLTFDMLAAIAEGAPWFGRRTHQAPTVYVCLEGEAALKQRKQAWERNNGRRLPENFYMVAQPWSIVTKKDIVDLSEVIPKGAVVAIDTQNRAAPAINESASEEMGQVIEGAKTLERLIEGVVGLVAHPGKDVTKGVRGHSSQTAAMDAAIEVSREGDIRTWRAAKVKDGMDGEQAGFKLQVLGLGYYDEDGDEVTSCVIDTDVIETVDAGGVNLEETEAEAWQCIKMLASASRTGEVTQKAWQDDLANQLKVPNDKTLKNRYYNARDGLLQKKLISKVKGVKNVFTVSVLTPVENGDF